MDILPTILELAQVDHPGTSFRGREVVVPRGKSWVGHMRAPDDQHHVHDNENHIHGWELFGNRAIRKGDWKAALMVSSRGAGEGNMSWELYNVGEDPAEQHDLAEERPEVLQDLLVHWATYVAETGLVEDAY